MISLREYTGNRVRKGNDKEQRDLSWFQTYR